MSEDVKNYEDHLKYRQYEVTASDFTELPDSLTCENS